MTTLRGMNAGHVRALLERGFVVVPEFFTAGELAPVLADYESLSGRGQTRGELDSPTLFSAAAMKPMAQVFEALARFLREASALRTDMVPVSLGSYITSRRVTYGLHVDFGADFWSQGTEHCIKVWIPLVKPDRARFGVTFARMDLLREREPELAATIDGRGAVEVHENEARIYYGASEQRIPMRTPLSEILETPDCGVGDLVLFRSDTIHSSQKSEPREGEPERVAWGFPIKWSDKVIERSALYCNEFKRHHMTKMGMAAQLSAFWYYRSRRISYAQYSDFEGRVRQRKLLPAAFFLAAYALEPLVSRLEERKRRSGVSDEDMERGCA